MPAPVSLYNLTRPELNTFVQDLGAPRFRADQLWQWLYRHLADSFDAMTNLPADFRHRLADVACLHTLTQVTATDSDDGLARKFLFRCADGQLIETVLMHYLDPADSDEPPPERDQARRAVARDQAGRAEPRDQAGRAEPRDQAGRAEARDQAGRAEARDGGIAGAHRRHTVCFSTQAGCAMGCVFCATGQMGLVRDLTLGECVEQLVLCARHLAGAGERLTNVVFMGMGEPLANWPATWGTVEALTDPDGFALSPRRLTISTVGIVPGIRRLASAGKPVRLAVSIHAADDALRSQLVPVNHTHPLAEVLAACRDYQAAGGRRITFEYVLIAGVNDRPPHAQALARVLRGMNCHVNLIPLNPTAGSALRPSSYADALAFETVLRACAYPTTLRMRRGIEIQAGCGQLRSRVAEGRLGRSIPVKDAMPA